MKTNKLGQESAFPYPSEKCKTDDQGRSLDLGYRKSLGMSQRLYLAGMAMQGILSSLTSESAYVVFMRMAEMDQNETGKHAIIRTALNVADELLRQESE